MDGLFLGPKRTYEDFKKQIPVNALPAFDSLRQFCISLGNNVVEDVRAHRIVFGKSISFRWFADLEPEQKSIIIKIQRNRKESPTTLSINHDQDLDEIKKLIRDAYQSIR